MASLAPSMITVVDVPWLRIAILPPAAAAASTRAVTGYTASATGVVRSSSASGAVSAKGTGSPAAL